MNDNELCKLMIEKYDEIKNHPNDDVVTNRALDLKEQWASDGTATREQMDRCSKQITWYFEQHGVLPKYE